MEAVRRSRSCSQLTSRNRPQAFHAKQQGFRPDSCQTACRLHLYWAPPMTPCLPATHASVPAGSGGACQWTMRADEGGLAIADPIPTTHFHRRHKNCVPQYFVMSLSSQDRRCAPCRPEYSLVRQPQGFRSLRQDLSQTHQRLLSCDKSHNSRGRTDRAQKISR